MLQGYENTMLTERLSSTEESDLGYWSDPGAVSCWICNSPAVRSSQVCDLGSASLIVKTNRDR